MSAAAAKRAGPDVLLWSLAGIFVTAVAFNALMVWVALDYDPRFAFSGAYCGLPGKSSGWQVALTPSAKAKDTVYVRVADGTGLPMAGVRAAATAQRGDAPRAEHALAWREDPVRPGNYRVRLPRPARGRWLIVLELEQNGEEFTHIARLELR